MIPSHLPVYDRNFALKITGNNPELADDLLSMLLRRLRQDIDEINHTSHSDDLRRLYSSTHKLLGAVRYCGLPRMEFILNLIETQVKKSEAFQVSPYIESLNQEAVKILETFSTQIAC